MLILLRLMGMLLVLQVCGHKTRDEGAGWRVRGSQSSVWMFRTKFHGNPSKSCWNISVWTKVVDQPTDRHYHPCNRVVSLAETLKSWHVWLWRVSSVRKNYRAPPHISCDTQQVIQSQTTSVTPIRRRSQAVQRPGETTKGHFEVHFLHFDASDDARWHIYLHSEWYGDKNTFSEPGWV